MRVKNRKLYFAFLMVLATILTFSSVYYIIKKPEIFITNHFFQNKSKNSETAKISKSGENKRKESSDISVFELNNPSEDTDYIDVSANTEFEDKLLIGSHPRLFIKAEDIDALKAKVNKSSLNETFEIIKREAEFGLETVEVDKLRRCFEANAFLYILTNKKENGKKAIDSLIRTTQCIDLLTEKNINDEKIGRMILGASLVYDWCYYLLDDYSKAVIISFIENLTKKVVSDFDFYNLSEMNGLGCEPVILRDIVGAGIALYEDRPEIFNLVSKAIFEKYAVSRRFLYDGGIPPEGSYYSIKRLEADLFCSFIFKKVGIDNIFGNKIYEAPYFWIYGRRPDGYFIKDGDMPDLKFDISKIFILSNAVKKDINYVLRCGEFNSYCSLEPVLYFIFYSDEALPENQNNLPLTKYFGGTYGAMIARTGWNQGKDSDDVVAYMKAGLYNFNGNGHLDAGNFELYYKGALAIDSGVYEQTIGEENTSHVLNYTGRTIAHNNAIIVDPKELFIKDGINCDNDGGQNWSLFGIKPERFEDVFFNAYNKGFVDARAFGPDNYYPEFSYLKCDLKNAYGVKVDDYKRSFVFINMKNSPIKAALLVFDLIVSKDPTYEKKWLLHSIEEPEINNNISIIKRTANGYSGKLINTTLLPDYSNLRIQKVGGQGNEFRGLEKNYPPKTNSANDISEAGSWRIEISPANVSSTDMFLNIMQITDDEKKCLDVEKIDSEKLIGARIYDKVVLLSKNGQKIDDDAEVRLPKKDEKYRIFISDLQEGKWKIIVDNASEKIFNIKNSISSVILDCKGELIKLEKVKE